MAYGAGEGQPFERASKLGHLKIIEDPEVQRLLELFERVDDSDEPVNLPSLSGHVDFAPHPEVENVVAIDGSDKPIPNSIRAHKKLAFVSATEMLIRRREVEALRANPIVDPRDLARSLEGCVAHVPWALPLAGISMPGETVVASIRKSVDHALRYHRLYDTLQFLVSREWLRDYEMDAWMHCTRCGREFVLQRSARRFPCTHCGEVHSLADYLSIAQAPPEDWVKVEAAASLRSIFEMLLLFRHVVNYYRTPIVLQRTLFVKDGPLLLRAHLSRLVGHLTRASPLVEGRLSATQGPRRTGAGAGDGMVALAAAGAPEGPLAAPDEGGGCRVPAVGRFLQPLHHLLGSGGMLAGQSAVHQHPLDGLRHVQPGAAQRRVQRHDAVRHQPQHEGGRLVATEVVQDEQQAQWRHGLWEGEAHRQAGLPALIRRAMRRRWCGSLRGSGQRRQDGCERLLQPRVQDRVRRARHAFDPHLARGWVEQREQLRRAVAHMLMGIPSRLGTGLPVEARLGDRLIRPRFILRPDRQIRLGVRLLDQPFFARASGSCTTASSTRPPRWRRRTDRPVWHQERSRCQVRSASCSTHQRVYVLTWGKPSAAVRSARCKVTSDHVAVPSRWRSGGRWNSARMRSRSAGPYTGVGPPPCRGSSAGRPSRLNRATNCATASPERRPTWWAAAVNEAPRATASSAPARATWLAGALQLRANCSKATVSAADSDRKGTFVGRPMAALLGREQAAPKVYRIRPPFGYGHGK